MLHSKVQMARLQCTRNLYYSHDYISLVLKLHSKYQVISKLVYLISDDMSVHISLVGGGPPDRPKNAKIWTYEEILPYVVNGQPRQDRNYRFSMYIPDMCQRSNTRNQTVASLLEHHKIMYTAIRHLV